MKTINTKYFSMENSEKSLQLKLRELLKCGICLERYDDPRTLSCEHSFCKDCIYSALPKDNSVFCCPTCRCIQPHVTSKSDIHSMTCSLHLRQSLDLFLEVSRARFFKKI